MSSAVALTTTTTVAMREHYSNVMEQLLTGANDSKLSAAPLQLVSLPSPPLLAAKIEAPSVEVPKIVTEYPLPGAVQTHEMAVVGDNMLVISQQTNSTLVKVQLDPITGRPNACARFLIDDFWAGLHGLAASQVHPGHVWASLQFKSLLIRINVGLDLASSPTVEQTITLPSSVSGPHCVCECGQDLWTSCKDSGHVVRVNQSAPTDCSIYPCSPRPIFIAMHPTSSDVYASLDLSSKIWRLVCSTGETTEIDISPTKGNTPVGLVAGPDGNVWFTLVGDTSGGTGTFARIFATGEFQWFSLTTAVGTKAGLLHLAFDWDYHLQQLTPNNSGDSLYIHMWLLGSSLLADEGKSIDAVFTVIIDSKKGAIATQTSTFLPTQLCATHRVLPHRTGLFVTELSKSSLAHIAGGSVLKPADGVGETKDFYSDFGFGQALSYYMFSEEPASRGALLGLPFTSVVTTTPQLKAYSAQERKRRRT